MSFLKLNFCFSTNFGLFARFVLSSCSIFYIKEYFSLGRTKVPATNSQECLQLRISGKKQSFFSTTLHQYFSPTAGTCCPAYSLSFQAIEGLVQGLIVPFVGNQLVIAVDDGKGVDQGGAQEGVHVLGHVFPFARSVLGPVGEVTHHLGGRSCWRLVLINQFRNAEESIDGSEPISEYYVLPKWHISRHMPMESRRSTKLKQVLNRKVSKIEHQRFWKIPARTVSLVIVSWSSGLPARGEREK